MNNPLLDSNQKRGITNLEKIGPLVFDHKKTRQIHVPNVLQQSSANSLCFFLYNSSSSPNKTNLFDRIHMMSWLEFIFQGLEAIGFSSLPIPEASSSTRYYIIPYFCLNFIPLHLLPFFHENLGLFFSSRTSLKVSIFFLE